MQSATRERPGSTLCPRPHGLRLTYASGNAAQSTIPHESKAMQSATRERRAARNARGLTAFGSRMRQATLLNQRSLMTAKRCNQQCVTTAARYARGLTAFGLRMRQAKLLNQRSLMKAKRCNQRMRDDGRHAMPEPSRPGSRMRRAKLLEPRADDCWIRTLITLTNHQPATFLALRSRVFETRLNKTQDWGIPGIAFAVSRHAASGKLFFGSRISMSTNSTRRSRSRNPLLLRATDIRAT
jgi:hypothetical protein